ncbi:MAG: phosphate acyltransferase PlsX [Oscillospiraceae bacterium]|nr:phosphate acyltransferase PlsX [Oscillospiraceae bacterium]
MKIILDAMGGDNAPAEILKGAAQALTESPELCIVAVGDEARIRACLEEEKIQPEEGRFEIVHAGEVIEMCDEPAQAIRRKKDSSMVVGLNLLKEGKGDAFVSAGSTGALHVGASLIIRTIKGVKRPALATVIPGAVKPYMLMDSGANVECRPAMLEAFGVMGSAYMNKVMGIEQPAVALVNNGAEESKGTPLYREAHQLLKVNPHIRFVGNIEPRDIPNGGADVVVCDGFTGNVILKLTEGLAKSLMGMVKGVFTKGTLTKVAFLLVKDGMKGLKKAMDSEEYGGAPLLGTAKPVIKAHGSSKAKAIKNAIRQARICVENDLCGTMAAALATQEKAGSEE